MKQILKKILQCSIVRRLGGAVAGMLIALAAYHAYSFGAGVVRAHLLTARDAVKAEESPAQKENMEQIGMRARAILDAMQAEETALD